MRRFFILLFVLSTALSAHSQTTRYFEFITNCGHGNWQDTSFIASATDQSLIDTLLAELGKPLTQRRFIGGPITYGNGGFNHNAVHWFLWHFIPDQWVLTELAAEVCDGCPYTDIDADTAYWIGLLGMYCPWSGQPSREVAAPTGIIETAMDEMALYPIPASSQVYINRKIKADLNIVIYNSGGCIIDRRVLQKDDVSLDVSTLSPGLYFITISANETFSVKKLLISR